MSKSYGNTVDLTENPVDMFFKLTQVSDELLPMFLSVLTDTPDSEIDDVRIRLATESNLQDARERFARIVTERLHGAEAAERAQAEFTRVVDQGNMRQDVEEAILRATEGAFHGCRRGGGNGARDEPRRRAAAHSTGRA